MRAITSESKKVAVSMVLMFVVLNNLPVANSLKMAPITSIREPTIVPSVKMEQCCYIDACSKIKTCLPKGKKGTYWTDACARTYDVGSNCALTPKKCCYSDACNKSNICKDAVSVLKDSCGKSYLVQPTCKLQLVKHI